MTKQDGLIIQSIERALIGLEMAANGGVRSAELAERLGVDRSTAYRILYTLMENGYVLQDRTSNRFIANPGKFFQLSSQVAGSRNWVTVAAEQLVMLRDITQHTANLAVLNESEMVIIAREFAVETPTVLQSLGARRPVHCSATGKAFIAFLSETAVDHIIQERGLIPLTAKTITTPESLRTELDKIRQQGYALDDEENLNGVRCIAAPLFDHSNQVLGAIGISGPVSGITTGRIAELADKVLYVAKVTSAALGAANEIAR